VHCNTNAPPHTYHCDWQGKSDYGVPQAGTAIVRTDGDRIWIADPGL
jgi:hypothetical protein